MGEGDGCVEEDDVGACANVDTTNIDAGQEAGAMGNHWQVASRATIRSKQIPIKLWPIAGRTDFHAKKKTLMQLQFQRPTLTRFPDSPWKQVSCDTNTTVLFDDFKTQQP